VQTLRDIMTTDPETLAPESSIRDAMALLSTRHLGGVPVLAGQQVVGVVSATDLLTFASSVPGVPERQPETNVSPDESELVSPLDEVETIEDDDEPPVTFFYDLWDDAGADVVARMEQVDGPEWDVLSEHVVSEAMNQVVHSLPPETPIDQAADYMRAHGIQRLLVMEDERLVGIVTMRDMEKAVST
jgi:CBS domain-containing protein